jgi:hypothetical protein
MTATTLDATALFDQLCQHLNVQPDRHGEAHVTCPWCNKEAKKGQVHFSFGENGGYCFCCGKSAGLIRLAHIFGLDAGTPYQPVAPRPKERPRPTADFERLAHVFETHPDLYRRWREYKPKLDPAQVFAYRLGYGAFPEFSSKCQHPRLMVPLIERGKVVGFRGRRIDCKCAKWLSPAGSRMVLFNGERIAHEDGMGYAHGYRSCVGRTLFIVENPIDALLLEQLGDNVLAVATLGVSMWKSEWTELVAYANLRKVWVCFDNDLVGNGGGKNRPKMLAEWKAAHPGLEPPEPNGVKLANALLRAGVHADLFNWPENARPKMDIGDLLGGTAS